MLARSEQVWLIEPDPERRHLDRWERLNLSLAGGGTRVVFVETLFPFSIASRRETVLADVGLQGRRFALFSPGGGGWLVRDRPAAEVFMDAARRVSQQTDLSTIVITGPLHEGPLDGSPGVIVKRALSPERLADLMHEAEIVVLGGGSSVGQAIAMGKLTVAAALGGSDQAARVSHYAGHGLVVSCAPEADRLAESVLSLYRDRARREAIRSRQGALPMRNGLATALDSLADLLQGRGLERA